MKKDGGLRLHWLSPGARSVRRELRRVLRGVDTATVACFAEERLPWIKDLIPEDTEVEFRTLGDLAAKVALVLRLPTRRLALTSQIQGALLHVCSELEESNSFYGSRSYVGLHDAIANTHREIRNYGIDSLDLRRAAETENSIHARKLRSLADVLDNLELRLTELERTNNAHVIAQILEQPPVNFRSLGHLVVFAGSERNPVAAKLLRYLADAGVPMSVFVDGFGANSPGFTESVQWAGDLGVAIEESKPVPPWLTHLFTESSGAEQAPQVQIAGMCDRVVECEWAMREAMYAMSEGITPTQIAIVARDMQAYAPLLSFAAHRFGVPLRANVRIPISSNALIRMMLALMDAVEGSDVRKLAFAVRSSYFGVARDRQREGLEALFTAHQRAEDPWGALVDWLPFAGPEFAWLGKLAEWRTDAIGERLPLLRWVDQWRRILEFDPLPATVMSAENPTYERDVRAKNAAENALVGFASAYSTEDRSLSLSEFAALAREVWDENEVTLPREHPSGVRVVSSPHQLGECQFVIALGMVEGAIPRSRREDPILSDEERVAIADALPDSIRLLTSYEKIARERDYFLSLCACAERRLLLTYPLVDEADEFRPAFYLQEIKRVVGQDIELPTRSRKFIVPPAEQTRIPQDLALRDALDAPRDAVELPELRHDAVKVAIRPDWEQGITFRDLAQAIRCPFAAHFGRIGIRNQDRRAVWRSLPQLPARAQLARQPDRASAASAMASERDAFMKRAFPSLDGWEVPLLEATCDRLLTQWTDREFRARELWPVADGSVKMNVAMGEEGLPKMLRAGANKIRIVDSVPVVGQLGEHRLLQFYVDRMPKLSQSSSGHEDDEEPEYSEFLYGLWAMSAARTSNNKSAIVIDSIHDERVLYLFTDQPSTRYNGEGTRFKRFIRHDPVEGWGEKLTKDIERAYAILDTGFIRPIPGRHCSWCELAELCRSSQEFEQGPEPPEESA